MDTHFEKALKSIYSLKKQRTIGFKLDEEIKKKSSCSPQKKVKLNSLHSHRPSLPSLQTPVESVLAISQRRQKLSSLFKSRLLPSQFLVTPADILKEMENKVYTLKTPAKQRKETIQYEMTPIIEQSLKNERVKYEPGDNLNSHTILQKTCQKMMQETKKSRKTINVACDILRNRDLLKEILGEKQQDEGVAEFKRRLEKARTQLPLLERVHSKSVSNLTAVYA